MRLLRSQRSNLMGAGIFQNVARLLSLQQAVLATPAPAPQGYVGQIGNTDWFQHNNTGEPKLGAVASESSICSRIGTDILQAGGNAADALVGTVFCIGVIGMYHSGIGGGGFMIVRAANGTKEVIDFRETAPAAAFENMYFGNPTGSTIGGLAVGIPGELRGLEYLHKKYGKMSWEDVMIPAISVARYGFPVSADLVRQEFSSNFSMLTQDPAWAIDFAPNGTLLGLGEIITRKRYADTLETISKRGADAFYTGPIAQATIRTIQRNNGTMVLGDLQNYTADIQQPVSINYRNYKLSSCGAPSSGEVALAVLKIMEGYGDFGWDSAINSSYHRLDEAMRFGYSLRTELGDPAYVPGIAAYQNGMLSASLAAEIRSKITNTTHPVSYYDPKNLEIIETPGTSHIVTADESGLSISLTTTINTIFGSRLIVPETGVILNNEMDDFSVPGRNNSFGFIPTEANFIRPGKRPLSSISPVIVEHLSNGSLYAAIGSAGGSRIITANIQTLWHMLDQNMTTAQALAVPRMHDQLSPNTTTLEYAFDNQTAAFLRDAGHIVTYVAPGLSTAQGLRLLPNGTFEAAGEPRQNASAGYAV